MGRIGKQNLSHTTGKTVKTDKKANRKNQMMYMKNKVQLYIINPTLAGTDIMDKTAKYSKRIFQLTILIMVIGIVIFLGIITISALCDALTITWVEK